MVPGFLKRRFAKLVLARSTRNGLDLRTLKMLPDSVTMPLRRVGLDPMPEMAEVRAEAPVTKLADLFGMSIWLVSGYDEARGVLAGGDAFSNDLTRIVSQNSSEAKDQIGGLGMTDPPGHTMLRKLLTPHSPEAAGAAEPRIEAIVNARLDAMDAAGPEVDLVAEFAFPVPFEVICELLGLPIEDRAYFHSLGAARFDLSAGGSGIFASAGESREFLIDAVARQRENPGEGLIGGLLADHGDELDDVVLGDDCRRRVPRWLRDVGPACWPSAATCSPNTRLRWRCSGRTTPPLTASSRSCSGISPWCSWPSSGSRAKT